MQRRVKLSAFRSILVERFLIKGCPLKWLCWSFNDLILPTLWHHENFNLQKDETELSLCPLIELSSTCDIVKWIILWRFLFEDGVFVVDFHLIFIVTSFSYP